MGLFGAKCTGALEIEHLHHVEVDLDNHTGRVWQRECETGGEQEGTMRNVARKTAKTLHLLKPKICLLFCCGIT